MTQRGTHSAILAALLAPLVLLALGAVRRGAFVAWLQDPGQLLSNWIYMTAPSGVAMLIALVVRKARQRFLPTALLALTSVLVAFQLWVWLAVPVRESALSWVLYHPLCLVTLVAVGLASAVRGIAKRPPAA